MTARARLMESVVQTPTRIPAANLLVAALPARDRRDLLAQCDEVDLALAEVLHEPGDPVRHVFFPTTSFVSLITPARGHARTPSSRARASPGRWTRRHFFASSSTAQRCSDD